MYQVFEFPSEHPAIQNSLDFVLLTPSWTTSGGKSFGCVQQWCPHCRTLADCEGDLMTMPLLQTEILWIGWADRIWTHKYADAVVILRDQAEECLLHQMNYIAAQMNIPEGVWHNGDGDQMSGSLDYISSDRLIGPQLEDTILNRTNPDKYVQVPWLTQWAMDLCTITH